MISTCEFTLEVRYEDQTEVYENVSFNIDAPNYIEKKTAKSDLITAACAAGGAEIKSPFDELSAEGDAVVSVSFAGGSNGSVSSITAADFIGYDNGASRRSGIQAFLDNDVVSILAVPGVTDPNVQLTLVAHCENWAADSQSSICRGTREKSMT